MERKWIVLLEAVRGPSSEAVDKETLSRLLDAVGHAMPVALHSAERYAVQLEMMSAESPLEALASALEAWSEALSTVGVRPWELVRVEVITRAELQSELAAAGPADAVRGVSANDSLSADFEDLVSGLTADHRPLMESALASDLRWRLLLHGSREVLTVLSAEGGVLLSVAPRGVRPLVQEDSTVASFADEAHPEDAKAVKDALAAVLTSPGKPVSFVARFGRENEWCWYESVATNLLDEPLVGAIVVNSRDLTEIKRLEERLGGCPDSLGS